MKDQKSYFALLFYFLAGGVAGVGAALLLAPQSGTATRDRIRGRLRASADSARGVIRQGEGIRDEVTRRVGEAVSALGGRDLRTARGTEVGATTPLSGPPEVRES